MRVCVCVCVCVFVCVRWLKAYVFPLDPPPPYRATSWYEIKSKLGRLEDKIGGGPGENG